MAGQANRPAGASGPHSHSAGQMISEQHTLFAELYVSGRWSAIPVKEVNRSHSFKKIDFNC